ncbi:unnamed protein product, partial [Amoebophrya sp. A25]
IFERRATRDPASHYQVEMAAMNNMKTNMWRSGTWNAKKWMDDLARALGERKVSTGYVPSFSKHGRSAHAGDQCHSFTDDHAAFGYHDRENMQRTAKMKQVKDAYERQIRRKAKERQRVTQGKNLIGVVGYTN